MALVTIELSKSPPGLEIRDLEETFNAKSLEFLAQAMPILQEAITVSIADNWLSVTRARGPRTGNLMASFRPSIVDNQDGTLSGGVFSDLVYARIHEEGGEIRPRRSKWLTIPLKRFPVGTSARDHTDLQLVKSKKGGLFLARPSRTQRIMKGSGLRPIVRGDELLWMLRKSVTITPKRYLKRAAEAAIPVLEDLAREFWGDAIMGRL